MSRFVRDKRCVGQGLGFSFEANLEADADRWEDEAFQWWESREVPTLRHWGSFSLFSLACFGEWLWFICFCSGGGAGVPRFSD